MPSPSASTGRLEGGLHLHSTLLLPYSRLLVSAFTQRLNLNDLVPNGRGPTQPFSNRQPLSLHALGMLPPALPSASASGSASDCDHPPRCPEECTHCLAYDRHTRSLCSQAPASSGSKWCAVHEELQVSPIWGVAAGHSSLREAPVLTALVPPVRSTRSGQGAQVVQAPHCSRAGVQ